MATNKERLDIVILGASGCTGMYCIPYIHRLSKEDGKSLTWGISGRSIEKLKQIIIKMSDKIGEDLSNTPIIKADIKNYDSLVRMAKKTKIIINCCGPYIFLGEPVVKACIEAGTHYVDVTAEPAFMETIQIEYQEAAKEKNVYIINACGLDCIPTDLGVIFLQDKFNGTLNSAVTYIFARDEGSSKGPVVNYGTWESLIYGITHAVKPSSLSKKIFPERLPTFIPKLKPKILPHFSNIVNTWAVAFPAADESIMKRSQKYLYENDNRRPVQVDTQFELKNILEVIGIIIIFLFWSVLVKFKCGRNLLLNYPHIFTFGKFRKNQIPSEDAQAKTIYRLTMYGEGWKEKLESKTTQFGYPPNRRMVATVKGNNPAYGITCACVVGAAIIVATEANKLPPRGGVYTPGAAFAKTSLIELLDKNGVHFNVESQKDL